MLPLLLLACAPPAFDPLEDAAYADTHAASGLSLSEVRYDAGWDEEGVTRLDSGWEASTELGYRVRVDSGWIVTNSVSLVPCATASARPLGLALLEATAFAGHGEEADPSALPLPVVQDLAALETTTLAELRFEAARYCQLHQLVARVIDGAVQAPEAPDLTGLSLRVEGAWAEEGGDWVPFTVESAMAFGQLYALGELENTGAGEALEVRLTRPAARLFDGVDFREADEDDIIAALLRAVIEGSQVSLRLN